MDSALFIPWHGAHGPAHRSHLASPRSALLSLCSVGRQLLSSQSDLR